MMIIQHRFFRPGFVCAPACVLMLVAISVHAQTTLPDSPTWDLKNIDQPGQFTFYDSPVGASTTGKPPDIGDFDGNGCGDLAVTGQNATHLIDQEWRGSVGHMRLLMNLCLIRGQISVEDMVP